MESEVKRIYERLIEEGRVVKTVTVDDTRMGSLTRVTYVKGKYPVVVLTNTDLKDGEPIVYWKDRDGSIRLQRVEPTGNPYKFKSVKEHIDLGKAKPCLILHYEKPENLPEHFDTRPRIVEDKDNQRQS
ncbi:MAG: hypothetical protein QXQ94_10395 [Candidatus Bathyarchaeia archaeon]